MAYRLLRHPPLPGLNVGSEFVSRQVMLLKRELLFISNPRTSLYSLDSPFIRGREYVGNDLSEFHTTCLLIGPLGLLHFLYALDASKMRL